MIRYEVDLDELEEAIDARHPTWRRRAAEAVRQMQRTTPRGYDERGPSWSEIKPLYMELQHHKCAYCERKLDGRIEHDVEHYRPKRGVEPWPGGHRHGICDGNPRGYCMLAYDPRNYCVACKTCNTTLKRNYFPIAGRPGRTDARDIAKLNERERPLLPYPLGDLDEDPEQLIGFVGFLPVPRAKSGPRRRRAQVTIELLKLGDDERVELLQDRCRALRAMWFALEVAFGNASSDKKSRQSARWTACAPIAPRTPPVCEFFTRCSRTTRSQRTRSMTRFRPSSRAPRRAQGMNMPVQSLCTLPWAEVSIPTSPNPLAL